MFNAELLDVTLFGAMPRYGDLGIHAVIDLRRTFSRAELEGAVAATLADFPVLGCRYEPRFWRDRWVAVEGPASDAVHVLAPGQDASGDLEEQTRDWVRRPIDPTRSRPLRLVSLPRGEGSRLILSLLHLAVDGAGLAAVGHVLGAHLHGVPPSLPVDRRRDLGAALERVRWYHLPGLARDVAATLAQPWRLLGAARRERPYPTGPTREPTWRHLVIPADVLARLKAACGRGVSINDLLVAALARISARRSTGGAVAIAYTMDLRRYGAAPRLTAANTSSILTVFVPRESLGDLATTAGAVATITARHRGGLVGPAYLLTPMVLASGTPHALVRGLTRALEPFVVDLPLSRGLFVTNVGRLDEGLRAFGDEIEELRVIGPILRGVTVPAVVAFGFRGRLYLELLIPPGLAIEALDELESELREALSLPPEVGLPASDRAVAPAAGAALSATPP